MKTMYQTTFLTLAVTLFTLPALADHHDGKGHHHRRDAMGGEYRKAQKAERKERRIRFLKEKVGLDDATIAKMKAIHQSNATNRQANKKRLKAARKQLRDLLSKDSGDQKAYTTALDDFRTARKSLHENRIATMQQVNALLTPKQQAKMVLAHAQRHHRRHGKHRGMRRGSRHQRHHASPGR